MFCIRDRSAVSLLMAQKNKKNKNKMQPRCDYNEKKITKITKIREQIITT